MKNWKMPARITFVSLIAIAAGSIGAVLLLASRDGTSAPLAFAVFLPTVGAPLAIGCYWMLWPTARMRTEQRKSEHSVERRWWSSASAASFYWLVAVLIWMDLLGSMLEVGWLSPMRMYHVLAAALLVYAVNYLLVRRQGA